MGKWKGAWEGLLRKIWGKPSASPEKHRESVNLRRKISSVVKCCWQFKQRRHEDMSIGCNYMNSLVGSFGNMVNTFKWSSGRWRKTGVSSGVTRWGKGDDVKFATVRRELSNMVKHSGMPWEGEREQGLHPTGGESTGGGFALDGRWAKSPIITGRMKETDHYGNSLFTQQFFTELTLCARYGARWWGYKGEQTQTMELKVQWSRHTLLT